MKLVHASHPELIQVLNFTTSLSWQILTLSNAYIRAMSYFLFLFCIPISVNTSFSSLNISLQTSSVCLHLCLFVYLFICLSVCLSICSSYFFISIHYHSFSSFLFHFSFVHFSYEDISTLLEIEEELNSLEQLTIIQLGDSISPGDSSAASNVPNEDKDKGGNEKDKKKSKSKLKSGKQTKSTKVAPVVAKKNTNTAPSSKKKALQGLLVLRPASVDYKSAKKSDSAADSTYSSSSSDSIDIESCNIIESKKGRKDKDRLRDGSNVVTSLPTLIVGRSSKQNDRITFEIAKEHHLWFHVQVISSFLMFLGNLLRTKCLSLPLHCFLASFSASSLFFSCSALTLSLFLSLLSILFLFRPGTLRSATT